MNSVQTLLCICVALFDVKSNFVAAALQTPNLLQEKEIRLGRSIYVEENGNLHLIDSSSHNSSSSTQGQMARELVRHGGSGSFGSVLSREGSDDPNLIESPFSSVDLFAEDCSDSKGNLLFLLSPMQVSVKNIVGHEGRHASIAIRAAEAPDSPITAPYVSLLGDMMQLGKSGKEHTLAEYCFLKKHPEALLWEFIPSHEFQFWRLTVKGVFLFAGDKTKDVSSGWVSLEEYQMSGEQWSHDSPMDRMAALVYLE